MILQNIWCRNTSFGALVRISSCSNILLTILMFILTMSPYQVSFRASYHAPGELSATTMKPKQKCDFGALGDTYPEMEN